MRWRLAFLVLFAAVVVVLPGYTWKSGYNLGFQLGRTFEATCNLTAVFRGAYPASCRDRLPAPSWPEGYEDYFERHRS